MNKKLITTLALFLSLSICTGVYSKIVNEDNIEKNNNSIERFLAAKAAPAKKTQTKVNPNAKQLHTTPAAKTSTTPAAKSNTAALNKMAIPATSLAIVNNPEKFLNKTVRMQATFDKFSTLGLDYQKALRSSEDYIGILIQRDDVINHNIPLSEMKLFLNKTLAEKHIDLDTGDKIEIIAKEFSTALGDPWLDVESITVVKKAKQTEDKK